VRRGRHAADDGSFSRSAGTALGRGLVLLAVAVLLGLFLLNRVDEPAGDGVTAGNAETTTTTAEEPDDTATTTTTAPMRAPKDVRVLTANGTSVRGAAGRVKDRLMGHGYNTLAATDASTKPANTAVYYTTGFEREAAAVAQFLGLAMQAVQPMPATPPVADLKNANVLVMVGADLAQQGSGAGGGSGTTTTTARSGTTTSTTR
jgi:hypothetical protein